MKKIVAIFLTVMMTLCLFSADAATYTLPEKMQKQQLAGSGLKGSFTLETEGTSALMTLLAGLNGREIQIRSISARDSEDSVTSLYLDAGEDVRQGLVEIENTDEGVFIRSDFTGDTVYSLGNVKILVDLLTAGEGQNIQPWTMLKQMLSIPDAEWETSWQPVADEYLKQVESWMNNYAASPETFTAEDGTSAFNVKFEMKPEEIRAGIMELMTSILNDETAVSLLSSKMEPEISAVYLNKDLLWYYQDALNAMVLNGPVTLSRSMTTKGDEIGSEVILPLGTNPFGFTNATANVKDGKEEWTFSGERVTVKYIPGSGEKEEENFTFTCGITVTPGTETEGFLGKAAAYAVKAEKNVVTTNDTEGKQYRTETLKIMLEPDMTLVAEDDAAYRDCTPLTFELTKNYSSKLAQTSSTTLELALNFGYAEEKLNLQAKVKTSSAWEMIFFDTANAVDLLGISGEELKEIADTLLRNVGK